MPVQRTNAAKAEALGSDISFEYDGATYTVPAASAWNLEALEAFEEGKVATCSRLILGAEQWKAFRAKTRTVADLNGLFTAMNEALGVPNS